MALITNRTFESAVPSIVEFSDYYAINGQLYNKYSLEPIPLKFLNNEFKNIGMVLKRNSYIQSHSGDNDYCTYERKNCFIVDKHNLNISYHIDSAYEKVIKYDIENNIVKSIQLPSNQTHSFMYQDENNIYILESHKNNFEKQSIIIVEKQNMEFKSYDNLPEQNDNKTFLGFYANNIYMFVPTWNGNSYIYKFNVFSKDFTTIHEFKSTGFISTVNPVKLAENNLTFLISNYNDGKLEFIDISIDLKTDKVNLIKYETETPEDMKNISFSYQTYYKTLVINSTTNKFVVLIRLNTKYDKYDSNNCSMYLFKLDNSKANLIQQERFPYSIESTIEFDSNKSIIVHNRNIISAYYFDVNTEKFICVNTIVKTAYEIGADENDNIFIHYQDGSLDTYNQSIPINYNAEFEKNFYDYKGKDIQSYIKFFAKNFTGKSVSCTVKLTLHGAAKFTANSSKTITKNFNASEEFNTTPVTIYGGGVTRVSIELINI